MRSAFCVVSFPAPAFRNKEIVIKFDCVTVAHSADVIANRSVKAVAHGYCLIFRRKGVCIFKEKFIKSFNKGFGLVLL